MKEPARRRYETLIVAVGLIAAMAICVYLWYTGWIPNQGYNLRVASRHAELMRSRIAGQSRWAEVQFGEFTGGPDPGGCLAVLGNVASAEDAITLAKLVIDSSPKVPIYWVVHVREVPNPGTRVILESPFDIKKIESYIEEQRNLYEMVKPGK